MAKEQVENAEIPDRGDGSEQEQEAPKTDVRSAITAAMEEVNDTGESGEDISKEREPKQRSDRQIERDKAESDRDNDKDVQEKDKRSDRPRREKVDAKKSTKDEDGTEGIKKDDKEEVKLDPPPFFKNKGKTTWERLSTEDKQVLLTREKEVSDGFAQISQRLRNAEELEQAVAPRLQAIQQFGVTPGVVVNRLFQWMEALNNPRTKLNTLKELASSFGVNVNQLVSSSEGAEENTPNANAPPEWFNGFADGITQKIATLESTNANQQRAAAENVLMNWAKDKPYYQQVGPLMAQLVSSGVVPLKDGNVDLDGAYEAAIKLHPEIAAQIQQDALSKSQKEVADKAAKDAKEKAEKLARARRAGAGIKPAAPSISTPRQLNGREKKDTSIRGAIRAAMEESRDN